MPLAFTISCSRTVHIPPPSAIAVPAGLTQSQVRLAIISAVVGEPVPDELTKNQQMADRALKVALWPFYRSVRAPREREWFLESNSDALVAASYQRGKYLLRVSIVFDTYNARVTIVDAVNLSYTKARVHKAVPKWIGDLEMRIRRSFSRMLASTAQ